MISKWTKKVFHTHIYQRNLNIIKNVSQFFFILYSADLFKNFVLKESGENNTLNYIPKQEKKLNKATV